MKYLCLAYEEQGWFDELSAEEWQTIRTETLEYVESLRREGRLIEARPLGRAAGTATVRVRDGKASVTDGPYVETKEQIGGYFLIEAADREEAIRIASGWPSARIGTIEVRPVDEELRLDRRYH